MPIKFRCQHCRQFLGISRGKAGLVVDCPTCGRSIRVPDLDGVVQPLPKPGLNLKDSELRNALDELANIGRPDLERRDVPEDGGVADVAPQNRLVAAEPIVLAPVAAAQPIEVEMQKPKAPEEEHGWRTTRTANDAWKALGELAEGDSSDEPVVTPDAAASVPKSDASKRSLKTEAPAWRWSPATILGGAGVAALVFTIGFWVGRLTSGPVGVSAAPVSTGAASESKNVPVAAPVGAAALRGRITFRTESGDRKPDQQARVIVLPMEWSGKTKLKVDGFRVGDALTDERIATASIHAMGGDFVTADSAGEYSVTLPSAGQYQIVVLSNSMSRPENTDIKAVETLCARYFERPTQLLGRVQVHTELVRYSGQGTEPWDYTFQRE